MSNILKLESKKPIFEIVNISEEKAEILIYDFIGSNYFFEGVTAKGFKEQLNDIPKSVKSLDIRINSPGGSVFEGWAIYNALRSDNREKTVYVDAMCGSIATIIAMAGDKIVMLEPSEFFIHKPLSFVQGNADEMLSMADRLDGIESQMLNVYARKTGIDRVTLTEMLRGPEGEDGTVMTPREALDHGFIDELVEVGEEATIAACAFADAMAEKSPWYKNHKKLNPASDILKEKAKNIRKKIEENQKAR